MSLANLASGLGAPISTGKSRLTVPLAEMEASKACRAPELDGRKTYTTVEGVTYKVAQTVSEWKAGFRLVYHSYVRSGLMAPNEYRMRVMPHHLLRSTPVFIAIKESKVICTVSLIGDADLGMPMESIYKSEVDDLRHRGLLLGEASCLADRRRDLRPGFAVLLNLTRLMAQYARYNGLDCLLIAVHPRHERFYSRYMGFERIGSQKAYESVCGNPAVAACLDFAHIDRIRPSCYDFFFGTQIPSWELEPRPMSEAEQEYFSQFVSRITTCAPVSAA